MHCRKTTILVTVFVIFRWLIRALGIRCHAWKSCWMIRLPKEHAGHWQGSDQDDLVVGTCTQCSSGVIACFRMHCFA